MPQYNLKFSLYDYESRESGYAVRKENVFANSQEEARRVLIEKQNKKGLTVRRFLEVVKIK